MKVVQRNHDQKKEKQEMLKDNIVEKMNIDDRNEMRTSEKEKDG